MEGGTTTRPAADPLPRLWRGDFAGVLALALLGFANLAAFYGLEPWLRGKGLDAAQAGGTIAAFTLVALVLMPSVAARVSVASAGWCTVAGFTVTLLVLPLYLVADGFAALVGLRLLHGFGFVLTLVGITTRFVALVPPQRAGEAYSLFSVADLLPFALLPPLLELTLPSFGGDAANQYAAMALLQAPALLLAVVLARRVAPPSSDVAGAPGAKAGWRGGPVLALLLINTAAFIAHAVLFSMAKGRALEMGGEALVGLFFALQTGTIMVLRLSAGKLFDRLDQRRASAFGAAVVTLALLLLALPIGGTAMGAWVLVPVALLLGIGFGACLPLLNALMHRHSPPAQRGANINLMMLTLQVGYLFGPLLGGLVVNWAGYPAAFVMAAVLLAPAVPLLLRLPR
ncbi:MFS transporter [Falsiroseomonas sp.]|jgi:predicted MFS family arabinose efflux permease|uniref:MFS transporter n=1 Tax=Falsiroseomonas sp. TaxID=2870721 RepID=UPI003F70FA48